MALVLDEDTRTKLDRIRAGVAHEFDRVPRDEVDARFERVVAKLLDDATFGDFVPVLAWRYAREALRTLEGLPAEFR
jgi:hypothetical protein